MKDNKKNKEFRINCQNGVVFNDPTKCQFSSPPKSQNTQIVYRNRTEVSTPLISPLTWFAIGLSL